MKYLPATAHTASSRQRLLPQPSVPGLFPRMFEPQHQNLQPHKQQTDYLTTPISSLQGRRHPSPPRINTSNSISATTRNDSHTSSSSLKESILQKIRRSEPFSQDENTLWSSILQSPVDPPTIMIDTSAAPPIETAASTGAISSVSFSTIRMSKDEKDLVFMSLEARPPIPHEYLVKKADQEIAGRGVSNENLVIPQNFDDSTTQP